MKLFKSNVRECGKFNIEAQMTQEERTDLGTKWEKQFLKELRENGFRPIRYEMQPVWAEAIGLFLVKGTARHIEVRDDDDD